MFILNNAYFGRCFYKHILKFFKIQSLSISIRYQNK